MLKIREIIWLDAIVEKLARKHRIEPHEFEEALADPDRKESFLQKGHTPGDDVYATLGRTAGGR